MTAGKTPIAHCAVCTAERTTPTTQAQMESTTMQPAKTKNWTRPSLSRCSASRTQFSSLPSTLYILLIRSRVYSDRNTTHFLQSFSNAFTDASRGVREDTALALSPMLKRARSTCPAPGRAFITGLLRFDDARKHFEKSSYQNYELNMAYAKLELCMFPRTLFLLACCIIR